MHVLCVVARSPYPALDASRSRTWHLLRGVAARGELTIVTWEPSGVADGVAADLERVARRALVLPLEEAPMSVARRMLRRARLWSGGEPSYVQAAREERGLEGRAGRAAFSQRLEALHAESPVDVVLLADEVSARFPLPDVGAPVVLTRHNIFARAIGDVRHERLWWRVLWLLEGRGWRAFDRDVMDVADCVVTPTPEMAAELGGTARGVRVATITNGVDTARLPDRPGSGRDVGFLGLMSYFPNADAAVWFATAVWPRIADRVPDARFRIVGRDPAPEVAALAADRIDVTGEVDDVTEACRGVRVAVVPLRTGMGIKTKTLDFMAMGLPVVATPTGAEGLAATPADGLVVASEPAEFASAVVDLLEDPDRADRLGEAARTHVERHHSWTTVEEDFCSLLDEVVRRGARAPG